MDENSKNPGLPAQILTRKTWEGLSGQNTIIFALVAAIAIILIAGLPFFKPKAQGDETLSVEFSIRETLGKRLALIQGNTLLPIADVSNPAPKIVRKIKVVATAYSSTVWQTDDTPFITASNTWVRKGVLANNFLDFGTRVKIPELYGDKIFVVEDRMHRRKSNYHIDIWFPSYQEAKNFGVKRTYIEILES